jgi:predicted outer membrane repeat protein
LSRWRSDSADNHGGAVFNDGGDVSATITSFRFNAALDGDGGAIRNTGNGTLSITRSEFFRNRAAISHGGAIADIGTGQFSVTQSQFSQNYAKNGGAIHAASLGLGTVVTTIDSVTFDWNKANRNGGAIYYEPADGQLTIVNSTFSQNYGDVGGALYNSRLNPNGIGRIEVASSTFYKNAALDGATIYNGRPLEMNNSIVTDRNDLTVGDVDNACRAVEQITGTGNLIGIASGGLVDISCGSSGSLNSGYVTRFDTTLGSNGGPTVGAFVAPMRTHALFANSNAVDFPGATCLAPDGSSLLFDQRGEDRTQGAGCDVGAVEQW